MALSVPLSRFTSRVGGGSAFYVRRQDFPTRVGLEKHNKQNRKNKMKNIKIKLITWVGLLVLCLLPIGAQATEHYQSGIIGFVDGTGIWNVAVLSADDSKTSISVRTDRHGMFRVDLKPGNYVLTPFQNPILVGGGQGVSQLHTVGPSMPVTVAKRRFTTVVLPSGWSVVPPITNAPTLHFGTW